MASARWLTEASLLRPLAGGSDGVQHFSAVHQRIFGLQQVGEPVELLEAGVRVMLAVRGMTGNLDRDGVFDYVLALVCAECDAGDPGADECASFLVLAPARQLTLGKQPFVLGGLLGTDMDDDDVEIRQSHLIRGRMLIMNERAGVWLRVSGDTQSEEDQEPDIRSYCHERGYSVTKVYVVHGKSAHKGAQDPYWQEVVRDFRDGHLDVVVCWMVDRLDRRNILHAVPMVLEVLNVGGRVEFSEQSESNLDSDDPDLDEKVKSFSDRIHAARAESKIKSKRILKRHRALRAKGSVIGRAPSAG